MTRVSKDDLEQARIGRDSRPFDRPPVKPLHEDALTFLWQSSEQMARLKRHRMDERVNRNFRARFSESEQRTLLSLTPSPRFGRHKLQGNRRPLCCRWQKPSPPRCAAPPVLPVCIGDIAPK